MYRIGVISGDGTGPEVVREALKALEAASGVCGFHYQLKDFDLGAKRYLNTGLCITDEDLKGLRAVDAILLGAIGYPDVKPGILERGILLRLRSELDLYINLRPVQLLPGVKSPLKDKGPEDIDFVVVRENTEGLYCGAGGFLKKGTPEEVAIQESINTRKGVERCIRYAFEFCQRRARRKTLTLCGKTNVLTFAFDLWERVFFEVARDYPDIKAEYAHVDALCMWMVKNPETFDVIVTDNMFGDIITDLGAMIQGGMGIACGANLNPVEKRGVFEPIGGSAPKYEGKNQINPLAAISACQMMLEFLGENKAASLMGHAIKEVILHRLKSLDAGRMGHSTTEVGDLVVTYIKGNL